MENSNIILKGYVPASGKGYVCPGIKVIALSTSAWLCENSITIPGIEDGGEWPDE